MYKGKIKCECGQEFYYETIRNFINCISCGKQYKVDKIVKNIIEKTNKVGD